MLKISESFAVLLKTVNRFISFCCLSDWSIKVYSVVDAGVAPILLSQLRLIQEWMSITHSPQIYYDRQYNGWCCAHSHRSCTHTAIMVKNLRHWIWDMNWPNHHFWIYFKQHFPQRRIESFTDDVCYRKGHWNVTFMNDALSTSVSIIRDEQLHDKSREK